MDIESIDEYTFSRFEPPKNTPMKVEYCKSPRLQNPNSQDVISSKKKKSASNSKNITISTGLDVSFGEANEPEDTRSPGAFTFFGDEILNELQPGTSQPNTESQNKRSQAGVDFGFQNIQHAAHFTSHGVTFNNFTWPSVQQISDFHLKSNTSSNWNY